MENDSRKDSSPSSTSLSASFALLGIPCAIDFRASFAHIDPGGISLGKMNCDV